MANLHIIDSERNDLHPRWKSQRQAIGPLAHFARPLMLHVLTAPKVSATEAYGRLFVSFTTASY